jgi:PAS domain S-box-containing protein
LRLLLLDDQPADAELALLELERAGYQVSAEVTQNLEEFTARLRTQYYDLVLSDFNLGESNGMDAFSVLKLLEKDTPFVLLSGSVGDEQAVDCVKQGVTDFVLKDHLVRLPMAVRRALAEHGLRAEQVLSLEALRKSESRFRRVIETNVMGVIICTLDGQVREANDAFLCLIGYSRQDLEAGQIRWTELTPPEFLPLDWHASKQLRLGRTVAPWEKEYIRKDGTRIPVLIGAAMLEGSQEEAVGFILDISERKRAEEALRQSHALLQGVVEGTSDTIFVKDLDGRYLMANSACAAALGRPREEILGKTDAELLDAESARNFAEGDRRALLAGVSQTSEEREIGTGRTYLATKGPYRDAQGAVRGIIGISRDISERKREQEALRQSEEKFAKAFGSSPTAISISTLREGRYVDVNDSFLQMTGYQRSEILGRTAAELGMWIHPETRVALAEALSLQGKVLEFEFLFRARNGEERVGALSAELIQVGGEPCLLANVRDDTEPRRAQQALLESQRQYESLVNSVDGIVWEADAQTLRFTFVSPQAERLLGYPPARWLQEPDFWTGHIHPEDRKWAVDYCLRATAEQCDHNFEYRMLAADGRTVWLRDMVSVVVENGQTSRLRGLMVDVTQQREMEQQLRQSQKMEAVGQLAGGVAHDFNNLLMVIRGYSELMLDRLEPSSVVRSQAEGILQAAQRASTVIRQLLAFSRKQVLSPKVLDLNAVVGEVGKMLLRLIGEDIELQVVKALDLGRVKADPGQLEQVILNLAVNARDAMPDGGKLILETRNVVLDDAYARAHISAQAGPYVLLAVTDNGVGMDPETRSRIFEPFFTTKEQGKGTGLGLATVYGIVKQSGGYIWVYSELGQGTTFKIYLPQVSEQPAVVPAEAPKETGRASETVLLVEDEEDVRKVVTDFLQARGYTVLGAGSGPLALRLAEQHPGPIHLLLTDVVMPAMGGRELAERMRQQQPGIKVLYMSGYTHRGAGQNHGLDPEDPFLEKPFSGEALARKLSEVLGNGKRVPHSIVAEVAAGAKAGCA